MPLCSPAALLGQNCRRYRWLRTTCVVSTRASVADVPNWQPNWLGSILFWMSWLNHLRTMDSNTFAMTGVRDIGLMSDIDWTGRHFGSGITCADFYSLGMYPSLSELLKMAVRGRASSHENSFSNHGGIPSASGPVDLLALILVNALSVSSTEIVYSAILVGGCCEVVEHISFYIYRYYVTACTLSGKLIHVHVVHME